MDFHSIMYPLIHTHTHTCTHTRTHTHTHLTYPLLGCYSLYSMQDTVMSEGRERRQGLWTDAVPSQLRHGGWRRAGGREGGREGRREGGNRRERGRERERGESGGEWRRRERLDSVHTVKPLW